MLPNSVHVYQQGSGYINCGTIFIIRYGRIQCGKKNKEETYASLNIMLACSMFCGEKKAVEKKDLWNAMNVSIPSS